jgi:hypothetical protein
VRTTATAGALDAITTKSVEIDVQYAVEGAVSGPARNVFLNALLVVVVAVQFAALPTADAESVVDGRLPCAEWLKWRASGNAAAAELWLSGMLLTLAAAEGVDVRDTDPLIFERWMDNYCKGAMHSTIGEGTTRLLQELKHQRGRAAKAGWLVEPLDRSRPFAIALRIGSKGAR